MYEELAPLDVGRENLDSGPQILTCELDAIHSEPINYMNRLRLQVYRHSLLARSRKDGKSYCSAVSDPSSFESHSGFTGFFGLPSPAQGKVHQRGGS
jgi:hypothetical protein